MRATLDDPDDEPDSDGEPDPDGVTDACVVACPPHPQHGGSRSDRRLSAVADALVDGNVACLRFDYGAWDEGRGERADAGCALDWAVERYERVGLFGYSFGATVALVVAAERDDVAAVAALAPGIDLPDGRDAAGAVARIPAPTLVLYGERDETVNWEPVVDAARTAGRSVEALAADHHFVGQDDAVGARVASFVLEAC